MLYPQHEYPDLIIMMYSTCFHADLRCVPPENPRIPYTSNEFKHLTCTVDYWGNGFPDMEWSLSDGKNITANITHPTNQSIVTTIAVGSTKSTESSVRLQSIISFRTNNDFNDTGDAKNIPKHTWISPVEYLLISKLSYCYIGCVISIEMFACLLMLLLAHDKSITYSFTRTFEFV